QPADIADVATNLLAVADADAHQFELRMFDDLGDHHLADESGTPNHNPLGYVPREKFGHQPPSDRTTPTYPKRTPLSLSPASRQTGNSDLTRGTPVAGQPKHHPVDHPIVQRHRMQQNCRDMRGDHSHQHVRSDRMSLAQHPKQLSV